MQAPAVFYPFSLSEMESSRRRSLRKREEKSYVESPDLIFEEETSSSSSTNKGKNVVSNGDVEMESDDDDEPLEPLPLPKVRNKSAIALKLALKHYFSSANHWHFGERLKPTFRTPRTLNSVES